MEGTGYGIGIQYDPMFILDEEGIGRVLEDRAEALLAVAQLLSFQQYTARQSDIPNPKQQYCGQQNSYADDDVADIPENLKSD